MPAKRYVLLNAQGEPVDSAIPGTFGGNRRRRIFGRLDCPSARRALPNGYAAHRVFFADEATAHAAGYRPCGTCMRAQYRAWRLLLLVVLAGCSAESKPEARRDSRDTGVSEWLLAAQPSGDLVHLTDSEEKLRARLGGERVQRDTVWVGEGDFDLGTVLFPEDPRRRLSVQWSDADHRTTPEIVRIEGGNSSTWRLSPGIRIGSSLAEIEKLNGRPFMLAGFEWDYGGTVGSWEGGHLDTLWGKHVLLRFKVDSAADPALVQQVLGDRLFPSSHPAMRALDPRVYDILVRPR